MDPHANKQVTLRSVSNPFYLLPDSVVITSANKDTKQISLNLQVINRPAQHLKHQLTISKSRLFFITITQLGHKSTSNLPSLLAMWISSCIMGLTLCLKYPILKSIHTSMEFCKVGSKHYHTYTNSNYTPVKFALHDSRYTSLNPKSR